MTAPVYETSAPLWPVRVGTHVTGKEVNYRRVLTRVFGMRVPSGSLWSRLAERAETHQ